MTVPLSDAAVLDALRSIRDPDLNRDIVNLKFVKNLKIDGGRVSFTIELATHGAPWKEQMREQARAAVAAIPGRHRGDGRDDGAGPLDHRRRSGR